MTLNEYQTKALSTCMDTCANDIYAINGLTAEVGEINDKIAKWIRKGFIAIKDNLITFNSDKVEMDAAMDMVDALRQEIGDVLWFVALLADRLDISLDELAQMNVDKLASRKARGVIDGNGDNR